MRKSKGANKDKPTVVSSPTTSPDSWKITGWSSLASVVQAVIAVLLLGITTWLMCQSNEIAKRANVVIENSDRNTAQLTGDIRRFEVQPILRVGAVLWRNKSHAAAVLRVSNAGNGAALDVNAVLKESGQGYCKQLVHSFYPIGVFPRLSDPQMLIRWGCAEPELDSMLIRDFILPGEELEFQYGGPLAQLVNPFLSLTLYFSYFDSDGNEYLTSTILTPGENVMTISLYKGDEFFDSLDHLELPASAYEYKTLVNPRLRERGRFFGTEEHWYDSSDSER